MKTCHLVNLLLAVTFVSVSADRAVSAELTAPKALATQIAHASAVEDWSAMKTIPKGGHQADGFQLAGSPQLSPASTSSDGLTAMSIGKTVGYVDASGRLMGLATP